MGKVAVLKSLRKSTDHNFFLFPMASANLGNTYSYSFVQGHSSFSRGKFYFSSFVYQVLNLSDGVLIYKALEKNKNTLNKTTLNNKKKKRKLTPLLLK